MRPYGTVSPLFWIGNTGKKLRADREAQVIALHLMTNPHSHQTGIYHLPLLYLATEVGGIDAEGALKALRRLEVDGFCRYDEASEWVWVCEMAAWQIGESLKDTDKRAIGVRQYLEAIPKSPFIGPFVARYGEHFHLAGIPQTGGSLHPSKGLIPIRSDQEQNRSRAGGEHEGSDAAGAAPPTKVLPPGGEGDGRPEGKGGSSPPKARKGSRIPEDFSLTEERRAVAVAEGISPDRTFAKFKDFWRAATKNAAKCDWDATWRNWCRNEAERNPPRKEGAGNGLPFAN